jgi:hypothetical protein
MVTLKTLGETANFIYQYDVSSSDGMSIAQSLQGTCENDLHKHAIYMPFGDRFSYKVMVQLYDDIAFQHGPERGGANNVGGEHPGTHAQIRINQHNPDGSRITDEYARLLFVAEVSELIMVLYAWKPGSSTGEALSRAFAEQFYPDATYDHKNPTGAPWVNAWLNTPERKNFIDGSNESNDRDLIAYGCSILFINYLRFQLGISLADICRAGGVNTLADIYKKLTGNTDDPLQRMIGLIDKHFDHTKSIQLLSNNPFPLAEGTSSYVMLASSQSVRKSPPTKFQESGAVNLRPFSTCPAKDYYYRAVTAEVTVTISATAVGFGDPKFQWSVNGTLLLSEHGAVTTTVDLATPEPSTPRSPRHSPGSFTIDFQVRDEFTWRGLISKLILTGRSFDGTYTIPVRVDVTEAFGGATATSAGVTLEMEQFQIVYEDAYYRDRIQCAALAIPKVPKAIVDLGEVAPVPPPEGQNSLIGYLADVHAEIEELATRDEGSAMLAAEYMGVKLNVSSEVFMPSQKRRRFTTPCFRSDATRIDQH